MDNDISREEKREWRKKLLDAITRVHQVDCLEHVRIPLLLLNVFLKLNGDF